MPAMFTDNRWPFTVTATSQQGNYPATNLNVIDSHPLLYSWRSNNQLTQQDLVCNIGAVRTITLVALLNCNFTNVQVGHSTSGINYILIGADPETGLTTITRNPFGKYRNHVILATFSNQYVRVRIPAQATTDGSTSFELGLIWIANAVFTFPSGPEVGLRQTPKRDYLRAGHSIATAGPWYSEEEWQMTVKHTQTSLYSQFILNGSETPQLIYKNLGVPSEVGVFRFRDAVSFVRNETTVVVNPTLEEMA